MAILFSVHSSRISRNKIQNQSIIKIEISWVFFFFFSMYLTIVIRAKAILCHVIASLIIVLMIIAILVYTPDVQQLLGHR